MNEEKYLRVDRMRFTKNSLASTLVIIAILFDVFYFINIYKSDVNYAVGDFYYKSRIGISIIYNLIFLLAAFLSSEGVKNYKREYCYVLVILGIIQIVRIFILPAQAAAADYTVGETTTKVMGAAQHARVVIYLLISAAGCISGAVVGFIRSKKLSDHVAALQQKSA